jgi:hypothetical protein
VKKSKKNEKSEVGRIGAMVGSFAAGVLMTWTIAAASSSTAKSEEHRAVSAQANIEQASNVANCSADICDLQLD